MSSSPLAAGAGLSTAVAIRNLGEEALGVSCRLMQEGAVLEEMEIYLEADGQEARFIEEMFTLADRFDFVGLVRCTAPGRFTGVAVELDAGNRIFTTLPVMPVGRTGGGGQEAGLSFAHFANGAGHHLRPGTRESVHPTERPWPHPLSSGHSSEQARPLLLR